jgi:hypothetical protein
MPDSRIDKICMFFDEIGIEWSIETITDETTFLPGIKINNGKLIFDPLKMTYVGDLLHEAGHIAVESAEQRKQLQDNVDAKRSAGQSLEPAVILWSYAALTYLNFEPSFVFHPNGYKGNSDWLIEEFEHKRYIGLPLLQWLGLASDEQNALKEGIDPFPFMKKWLV